MKEYIGDGVYAEFDGYSVELSIERLENGMNYIVLEPREFKALQEFWAKVHEGRECAPKHV